ncbi:Hypothetical protein GL50581_2100 [Giardia duodenalis ATCC 50581]|uniref:Uncharacterized protein n=2 Tax=Giardia intestinalis TaxID=5741 RepID=C6LTK3_GIAIB|nr:Hypothetical protein GL50581_2100 [Giardia intestinalis ATCC 50581]
MIGALNKYNMSTKTSWKQELCDLSRSNGPEPFFQRAKVIVHILQTNPEERQQFLENVILEMEEGILLVCAGYSSLLGYLHRRVGYMSEYTADNIISTVVAQSEKRRGSGDEQAQIAACACFISIMSALSSVNTESSEKCLCAYQTSYMKLFSPQARAHCQASLALSLVIIAGPHPVRTLSVAQDLLIKPSDGVASKSVVNYLLFLLAAFGERGADLVGPYVGPFSLPLVTVDDIKAETVPINLLKQLEATLISDNAIWIYSRSQDINPGRPSPAQNRKTKQIEENIPTKDMQLHPVWKHLFAFYAALYKAYGESGAEVAVVIQSHLVRSLHTPIKDYSQDMCYIFVSIFEIAYRIPEYDNLLPRLLCAGGFLKSYVLPNSNKHLCATLIRYISKWCYADIHRGRDFAVSLRLDPVEIYGLINTEFGRLVLKRAPEDVTIGMLTHMASQLQRCLTTPLSPERLDAFLIDFSLTIKTLAVSFTSFSNEIVNIFFKFFSLFYYQLRDHSLIKHPINTEESYAMLRKGRQKFLMTLEPLATADAFAQLAILVFPSLSASYRSGVTGAKDSTSVRLHYPVLLQTGTAALGHLDGLQIADNDLSTVFARHYEAVAIAALCSLLMGLDDEHILSQSTTMQNVLASVSKATQLAAKGPQEVDLDATQVSLLGLNHHFHISNSNFGRVASVAIMKRIAIDLTDRAFKSLLSAIRIAPPGQRVEGEDESEIDSARPSIEEAVDEKVQDTNIYSSSGQGPYEGQSPQKDVSSEGSQDEVSAINGADDQYDKMLVDTFKAHRAAQAESVNVFMRAARTLYPLSIAMEAIPDRPMNWDALEALYTLVSNPLAATMDEYGFQHPAVKQTSANKQYIEMMVHRSSELIGSYTQNKIVRSKLFVSDLFICYEMDGPDRYELKFRWDDLTTTLIQAVVNSKHKSRKQAEDLLAFVVYLLNTAKRESFVEIAEDLHEQYDTPIQEAIECCARLCTSTADRLVETTIKKMVRNRDLGTSSHIMKRYVDAGCYSTIAVITNQFSNDTFVSLYVAEEFILLVTDALSDWCNGVRLKRIEGSESVKNLVKKLLQSMFEWLAIKNNEAERSQQLTKLKYAANRIKKIVKMCEGIVSLEDGLRVLDDTRQKIITGREAMRVKAVKR